MNVNYLVDLTDTEREQLGVERITTRRGPREQGGFALDVGGAPIRVG